MSSDLLTPHTRRELDARIHSVLARHPEFSRRNLRFELHGQEVVLKGVVATYYQKQMAQESVRTIHGVGRIRNELEVS